MLSELMNELDQKAKQNSLLIRSRVEKSDLGRFELYARLCISVIYFAERARNPSKQLFKEKGKRGRIQG